METQSTIYDKTFHALSDPTRRAVVSRLMERTHTVKELAEPFDMGLPAFLKHIKVLENSGLVKSRKEGRVRTCQIQTERIEEAETWLAVQRKLWTERTDRLADFVEQIHEEGKQDE